MIEESNFQIIGVPQQRENTEVQIFSNEEFGQVRIMLIDDEPWFVGKEVAERLGYAKPLNALATHIDEDDSLKRGLTDSLGREQQTTLINESGLYSLIMSSKLPDAKRFKRWVTSEVLPSIRKTGGYAMKTPRTFAEALRLAADQQEQIEQQQKQLQFQQGEIKQLAHTITTMEKKVSYLDKILACPSTVKIKTIAQDYGMTAQAFNIMLHQYGIQYKSGDVWVLYAKYLPEGYVKDVQFEYTKANGTTSTRSHTQWTQKGRMFLYHFLKEHGILPLIERAA